MANDGASTKTAIFAAACGTLACCLPAAPAVAQNSAGTPITNIAGLAYSLGNVQHTVSSNPVSVLTAERLDVALTLTAATIEEGTRQQIVRATLSNTGNGAEVFLIEARANGATVVTLAIDSDGDGRVGDGDERLTDRTAALPPGRSLALLAVVSFAAESPIDAPVTLEARAATGSGTAGLSFDGQGDGGSDAVVGPTGARASISTAIGTTAAAPQLIKTQAVVAPGGGDAPVAGAIITYSLEARFPGPASAARIDDDVPSGTRFVPGSIVLDGRPLSDAAGDDVGTFDGTRVSVTLGDITTAATRSIQFQAIIQ